MPFGNIVPKITFSDNCEALKITEPRQAVVSYMQAALRGSRDWDGGRKLSTAAAGSLCADDPIAVEGEPSAAVPSTSAEVELISNDSD